MKKFKKLGAVDGRPTKVFFEGKWRPVLYTPSGYPFVEVKVGKKHRMIIDLESGSIICSNPLPIMAAAAGLKIAKKVGAAVGIGGGKAKSDDKMQTQKIINIQRDEFDTEERVSLALK